MSYIWRSSFVRSSPLFSRARRKNLRPFAPHLTLRLCIRLRRGWNGDGRGRIGVAREAARRRPRRPRPGREERLLDRIGYVVGDAVEARVAPLVPRKVGRDDRAEPQKEGEGDAGEGVVCLVAHLRVVVHDMLVARRRRGAETREDEERKDDVQEKLLRWLEGESQERHAHQGHRRQPVNHVDADEILEFAKHVVAASVHTLRVRLVVRPVEALRLV
mmetsp:Transcript_25738/g.84730  ORF Transcript_25738/g.84730 Transcript_25738/m.84730 type:complete len:217 (-) Transcript_25738:111-761(-)